MILPDETVVKLYKALKTMVDRNHDRWLGRAVNPVGLDESELVLKEADQYFNRSIKEKLAVMQDVELCAYWNILNMNASTIGNDAATTEMHLAAVREILKDRQIPFEEGKLIIKKTVLAKGSQNQNKKVKCAQCANPRLKGIHTCGKDVHLVHD